MVDRNYFAVWNDQQILVIHQLVLHIKKAFVMRDPVEALQEEEPRPSLNAHIQNIQLMLLKIGDHKVAFQAREENRVADKIAKEDLF